MFENINVYYVRQVEIFFKLDVFIESILEFIYLSFFKQKKYREVFYSIILERYKSFVQGLRFEMLLYNVYI